MFVHEMFVNKWRALCAHIVWGETLRIYIPSLRSSSWMFLYKRLYKSTRQEVLVCWYVSSVNCQTKNNRIPSFLNEINVSGDIFSSLFFFPLTNTMFVYKTYIKDISNLMGIYGSFLGKLLGFHLLFLLPLFSEAFPFQEKKRKPIRRSYNLKKIDINWWAEINEKRNKTRKLLKEREKCK